MRPPRVSLAGLILIVAASGVGFASLRSPSQLWAALLFSLALGTLTVSAVAALISRERKQAFWVGFSICGLTYFVLVFGPWFSKEVGPRLVTTALLDIPYEWMEPPVMDTPFLSGGCPGTGTQPPATKSQWSVWTEPDRTRGVGRQIVLASPGPYRRIGHSLICLVCAAAGGLLGRRFFDGRSDRRSEAAVKAAGLIMKVLEAGL